MAELPVGHGGRGVEEGPQPHEGISQLVPDGCTIAFDLGNKTSKSILSQIITRLNVPCTQQSWDPGAREAAGEGLRGWPGHVCWPWTGL